jgi:hypothetical protein
VALAEGFEPSGSILPSVFWTDSIDHSDKQAYGAESEIRTRRRGIDWHFVVSAVLPRDGLAVRCPTVRRPLHDAPFNTGAMVTPSRLELLTPH